MSYAKENVQAASCAGEATTGDSSSVNKSAPPSRIEQLEMYKAKKRETVKGVSSAKERNVLTTTGTSTANVKPYGWLKAATPHHYTPSPVLARVRKRLEGARPPAARAGARDVASAFKVSMAKTAAENAGNIVTKAPPRTADSQPISTTKVPQKPKAGQFNSRCFKDRSDLLHSQIVEADDLKLKSGSGAARLLLEEIFKQELTEKKGGATAGDFCLYWAARSALEEAEGKYSEARAILDEGEAYVVHPVQNLVMARVSADFDARQVQLKAKELNDLLDDGDEDDKEESVSRSDGNNVQLLSGEENEEGNGKAGISKHEEDNCGTSFTESDHVFDVRAVGGEESRRSSHSSQLIDEDYKINTIEFSSLSVQDNPEHDYGSVHEDEVLDGNIRSNNNVEHFSQIIKADMQQLPELPYCNKEEGGNDGGKGTETPSSDSSANSHCTTTLEETSEKGLITPEKAVAEDEERNNLMNPPSPVIPKAVKQGSRKSTPRPPRRSPRLARMNSVNAKSRTPSPIKRHMEELLND